MNATAASVREQIELILQAWGMRKAAIETTATVMVETDLAGIDSHGLSMLMKYESMHLAGQFELGSEPRIVRQTAVTALLDAGNGMGHPAAEMAMRLAIDKAAQSGVGIVSVFNSNHFGAAGYYAGLAAERGMIGLVTSTASTRAVVPTRSAVPMLATNPIAFAAPGRRNAPFLLDIATATVAANKVKVYEFVGKDLPPGWVVDEHGQPVCDPAVAMDYIFHRDVGGLSPIGGTAEMSSHKGYGLGVMVQILSGALSGAAFEPARKRAGKNAPSDIGHFFLAIDPCAFRPDGAFEDDVDEMMDTLRAARPSDPGRPVLVAGDPERAERERRRHAGIPVSAALAAKIGDICGRWNVPFVLVESPA